VKLPQDIEGIYREGRTDSLTCSGVEPLWMKSIWRKTKKIGRKVGSVAWHNKCLACYAISNPIAALACQQACKRI
jgi:hypothetical protein